MQWVSRGRAGRASLIAVLFFAIAGCGGAGSVAGTSTGPQGSPSSDPGQSSISDMELGDVEFLDFGSGEATTVSFEGNAGNGTFVAVINSSNIQEGTFNLVVQGDLAGPAGLSLADDLASLEEAYDEGPLDDNPMHALVRSWAPVYATMPDVEPAAPQVSSLSTMSSALAVGDTKSFRVLNSLSSVSLHTSVDARLRYIGSDVLIYVDAEMNGSADLTDEQIEELAGKFEDHAISLERSLFGNESDVNGDGRITVLMTPVLNRICQSSGIVTGFFFPGDLYTRSTTNPASNEQEIFYTLVPDSLGSFCKPIGVDFALQNILPGVLAHEYQHMISFNQHVFRKGGMTEEPWLNEALSHLTEDLAGFGQENYSRMKIFLDNTNTTTLVPSGSPMLAERGMGYMFLRYLYEQIGDSTSFFNNLLQTSMTGADNIEQALPGNNSDFDEFSELLSNWQIALVMTGTGLTSDPRYNYQPRTVDSATGNYQGICLYCDAEDGRGTVLQGPSLTSVTSLPLTVNIESTGLRFFRIDNPGSELVISGGTGAQFGGALISLEDPQ